MRKLFTLITFMSCFVFANGQLKDCSSVKNGKFRIVSEGSETIIERKGAVQIETDEHTGFKGEFKIKWLNDCTYTIQVVKIHNQGNIPVIDHEMIITTKILRVEEDYYLTESTTNKYDIVLQAKIYRIK